MAQQRQLSHMINTSITSHIVYHTLISCWVGWCLDASQVSLLEKVQVSEAADKLSMSWDELFCHEQNLIKGTQQAAKWSNESKYLKLKKQ